MIVVFTGPSLPPEEARKVLDAVYLPPAAQGDVYRASLRRPFAIGLIDGFFRQVASVWHKEILWALAQGIHVFGAASMGALRAAELESFGMTGVGAVFEAFRDGLLEDDDEVALVHAPAELGYRPLSEPMVNVRASIRSARSSGVVSPETADLLIGTAKSLFYADRSYERVLGEAARAGAPAAEIESLRRWLATGRVDAKRRDAVAMLVALRSLWEERAAPPPASFTFETTALWAELVRFAGVLEEPRGDGERRLFAEDLVRELDARGLLSQELRDLVLARILAADESRRHGFRVGDAALERAILDLRRRLGLERPIDLERWLDENDVDLPQFLRLAETEARLAWARSLLTAEIDAAVLDHLRATGRYPELKRETLDEPDAKRA